ncbi:MAG: hypothetical protein M3O46_10940 [Myxococcota bacterium]|nr:hypothetical protein [Myxococcota bacterium]
MHPDPTNPAGDCGMHVALLLGPTQQSPFVGQSLGPSQVMAPTPDAPPLPPHVAGGASELKFRVHP